MSRGGAACALALLLAAAGVAAHDAHAQSNTQRLAAIESAAAGVSNVVDAIRDALDGAAAGLADALAALAGVRGSVDSLLSQADRTGSNLAELRDEIRALQTGASDANAAASSLGGAAAANGAAVGAAAGNVSALGAGASNTAGGVASLNGGVSNVREGVASLDAGAAAAGAAARALAGNVSALGAGALAAHNLAGALDAGTDALAASLGNGTENGAHAKMDMIHAELVRHGEAPSGADGAAAVGIAAANARLDSLETALQRVEGALLAVDANLRNVETTVANGTFGRGQAGGDSPSRNLVTAVTTYTVDTSHYARTVAKPASDNIYRYSTDFACRSEVFVQKVEVAPITIMNNTGTATTSTTTGSTPGPFPHCTERDNTCSMLDDGRGGRYPDTTDPDCPGFRGPGGCPACPTTVPEWMRYCPLPQLPREYDANPFGPDAFRFGERSTITAQGRPVVDTMFTPTAGAAPIRFHQPAVFDLLKLSPGSALKITSVMNATILTQQATVFEGAPSRNYSFFDHAALTGSNGTLADRIKLDLYRLKVTSLAPGDPGCRLGSGAVGGAAGTYGPERSALLAVTGEGGLIGTFNAKLDCNDRPARITSPDKILFSFGGTVGAEFVDLASLALRAGGASMEFKFDNNAAPVHKAGTASSLAWNNGDLELSGTIPLVQGAVIQVTYQTVPGNSCAEAR